MNEVTVRYGILSVLCFSSNLRYDVILANGKKSKTNKNYVCDCWIRKLSIPHWQIIITKLTTVLHRRLDIDNTVRPPCHVQRKNEFQCSWGYGYSVMDSNLLAAIALKLSYKIGFCDK